MCLRKSQYHITLYIISATELDDDVDINNILLAVNYYFDGLQYGVIDDG